jgi:glycosyltransferase involved in cell wall biosynthesis
VRRAFDLDPEHMTVVFNGIAPCFLQVETPVSRQAEAIFFGRLTRQKGVFDLVDALTQLGDDAPPFCFVGRGPAARQLRARVREAGLHDRVRFVDWLAPAQLAQRLSSARLAVLPSWEESFGNAMAEAMATGTPLVSTRVGSIPELAEHASTAWLVPPRRPKALADAIRRLWTDRELAEGLAAAGRASARERFDWAETARRYVEVYRSLRSSEQPTT